MPTAGKALGAIFTKFNLRRESVRFTHWRQDIGGKPLLYQKPILSKIPPCYPASTPAGNNNNNNKQTILWVALKRTGFNVFKVGLKRAGCVARSSSQWVFEVTFLCLRVCHCSRVCHWSMALSMMPWEKWYQVSMSLCFSSSLSRTGFYRASAYWRAILIQQICPSVRLSVTCRYQMKTAYLSS